MLVKFVKSIIPGGKRSQRKAKMDHSTSALGRCHIFSNVERDLEESTFSMRAKLESTIGRTVRLNAPRLFPDLLVDRRNDGPYYREWAAGPPRNIHRRTGAMLRLARRCRPRSVADRCRANALANREGITRAAEMHGHDCRRNRRNGATNCT